MSANPLNHLILSALVALSISTSVIAGEKPTQNLRTDTAPGQTLDREAGDVRFGDGINSKRPASGQNTNRQPSLRLKDTPIQKLPNKVIIRDGSRYEKDKDAIRKKRMERMRQSADESADDDSTDDAKKQIKKSQQLIQEQQENQTQVIRKINE